MKNKHMVWFGLLFAVLTVSPHTAMGLGNLDPRCPLVVEHKDLRLLKNRPDVHLELKGGDGQVRPFHLPEGEFDAFMAALPSRVNFAAKPFNLVASYMDRRGDLWCVFSRPATFEKEVERTFNLITRVLNN